MTVILRGEVKEVPVDNPSAESSCEKDVGYDKEWNSKPVGHPHDPDNVEVKETLGEQDDEEDLDPEYEGDAAPTDIISKVLEEQQQE